VVDLLYVVILVAFFALMVAFVHLCERVVGKEEPQGAGARTASDTDDDVDVDTLSTSTEEVPA